MALIREFAEFENLSDFCEVAEESLAAVLFGEEAFVEALIAVDQEQPIGYAIFFPYFASFRGQRGVYLEDIYINADQRGKGIGKAMLSAVACAAAGRGGERLDFLVLDWNVPAVKFYQKLGAVRDDDERHFKFVGDAFQKLTAT